MQPAPTSPEIERLWTQLLHYIEEGRVVPIVGPGLLGGLGHELAVELANRMGVSAENLPPGRELNTVACRHLANRGRLDELYTEVFQISRETPRPIPEALLQLAEIPPLKLFVSTTFDSLLEQALNQVRQTQTQVFSYSLSKFQDLRAPVETTRQPVVYHLFGKLTPAPEFALTDEDTLEFIHSLQSETRQPVKLYQEIEDHSLLVLGSRLTDWLARFFLRTPRRQRLSADQRFPSFIADEDAPADTNLIVFLNHFSRGTRVFASPGPAGFVRELHSRWKLLHPAWEGAPAPGASESKPFVFLSYASEDEAAARRIYDALSAAKIQVFFDKHDLHGGVNWDVKLRRSIRDECSVFIPVISANVLTQDNRYFRVEWNVAREVYLQSPASFSSEDVFFLPVAIDSTSRREHRLPDEFRNTQWVQLPGGQPTPEFVGRVVELHRRYQQAKAGVL